MSGNQKNVNIVSFLSGSFFAFLSAFLFLSTGAHVIALIVALSFVLMGAVVFAFIASLLFVFIGALLRETVRLRNGLDRSILLEKPWEV